MDRYIPKWQKEFDIFSKIRPVIILEGNVLDKYQYPGDENITAGSILRLTEYLYYHLKDNGYESVVIYDSLTGFYNDMESENLTIFSKITGHEICEDVIPADFGGKKAFATKMISTALTQNQYPTAVIMDLASRYISSPDNMEQSEIDSFTELTKASLIGRDVRTTESILKNIVILIVNKFNDIPAWFYLENPNVKTITINAPAREERERLIDSDNFQAFFSADIFSADYEYYQSSPEELDKIKKRFVAMTEGFRFTELNGLRRLCKNEKIHIKDMCSVIDLYKYGISENPWNNMNFASLKTAERDLRARVKGQDHAVSRALDVIKRAVTGMTGLQSVSFGRPKGVLFFAGPTGTGKTETAKTLAEKLFGDERACIRFDMSEYGQSNSDQRLLGAPPGYVGYEAGGQLTNAVRNNPFSIILFDEIEKAHPSILDKFLQILEDGRMTDGQGNTVYFSESVIIFTSNLGIYSLDDYGRRKLAVSMEQNYEDLKKTVRNGIEHYFKFELGRPEILNRLGENIIVFDFIRKDAAKEIFDSQLDRIKNNLKSEKNIILEISEQAYCKIFSRAIGNLENGGRGIGNIVENMLIDPLSRFMFDKEIFSDSFIEIVDILEKENIIELDCRINT